MGAGGIPVVPLAGVVRGRLTFPGAAAGSWRVRVPRIHGVAAELGPFEALEGLVLASGDRVVLAPVEGRADDLIIIGKLPPG